MLNFTKRIKALQEKLAENDLDYLFITNLFNIYYLTGFKGVSETEREVTALIDNKELTLFSPKLYQEEARSLSQKNRFGLVVVEERHFLFTHPVKSMYRNKILGVEADDLRASELNELKIYSKSDIKLTQGLIESLRLEKDPEELKLVKSAVKITDDTFQLLKKEIKIGLKEKDLAKKIVQIMDELGADGPAFDPIVASGINSAFPHHITGNTIIKPGILLIDAGAKVKGYNADLTRTYYIGKPEKKFVKTYNLLLKTQKDVLENIKSGIKEEEPWKKAIKSLGKESKFFTHGLGHGVGLEVHESPYLRMGKKDKLETSSLVTIEPGLYYPNWGGIRIEDYILIENKGCQVLSKTPKNIDSIIV